MRYLYIQFSDFPINTADILSDFFQDNCVHRLLKDYMSSGVCEQKNPLNYPLTSPCVLDKDGNILKGVCSEETEEMI